MTAPVAAIVLAAGASRRLGQPKQLLMHGGEALLLRAIRLATEAGSAPVIAVLGANSELIRAAVDLANSIQVINNRWEEGISTSIHAGLHALDEVALDQAALLSAGALILACDQPRLTANYLRALMETFASQTEPSIIASAYAGVVGTPAVFPRMAFPQLRALRGDKGARALLAEPPCSLIAVPFAGGEVDIDEPGDLGELG
jgi:molybdenum cofactor cytidylyltransferase